MNKSKRIKSLFEKRIDFENTGNFRLPDAAYTSNKWSLSSLQNRKDELNRTKSLLNDFNLEEWSRHTRQRDPSSNIMRFVKQKFNPELVTQAWCKFYECLSNYPIIPKESISDGNFSSVHLCEAPGAFVTALNHYMASYDLNIQWTWYANSLNPDHEGNSLLEMIPDDRLLRHTYDRWQFGADCTGNITRYHNHLDLLKKIREKVWLVTADGSVDCSSDPGNQETYVEYLHYCESLTALSILRQGGTFVLKIFTAFEDTTVCLLYLLAASFRRVSTFKPASSKSGNSEVYVICLDYKGPSFLEKIWTRLMEPYRNGRFDATRSMFGVDEIDEEFLNQLLRISDYFMRKQIERISENIERFQNESQDEVSKTHKVKVYVANRYIHKYELKKIFPNRRIVADVDVSHYLSNDFEKIVFVNGSVKIDVASLTMNFSSDILDVKLGERVSKVKSSRFCRKEALEKFRCDKNQKTYSLYRNIEESLNRNTTVVNFDTCNFNTYHEFQKFVFTTIFDSVSDHLMFVKVPFVTNFLVGLMFVLISSYNEVYLQKNGFILFYDSSGESCKKVKQILQLVHETYRRLTDCEFSRDIFQIVAPSLFYDNSFFKFVWNYNDLIFSKIVR